MEDNASFPVKFIPKNGIVGMYFKNIPVILANISEKIVAFYAICTHLGCNLSLGRVAKNLVQCPCHGSRFDLLTGEVLGGPASRPLSRLEIEVHDEKISIKE